MKDHLHSCFKQINFLLFLHCFHRQLHHLHLTPAKVKKIIITNLYHISKLFSCTCLDSHEKFNPGLSSTYRHNGSPLSIEMRHRKYGLLGYDTVTVRNKSIFYDFELENDYASLCIVFIDYLLVSPCSRQKGTWMCLKITLSDS